LFLENWYDHGIYLVKQLFNCNGVLLSYSELLKKYGIPIPPKEYAIVFDAIPSGVIMLLKSSFTSELTLLNLDPAVTSVGQICFCTKKSNNNCNIRALFQKDIISVPNVVSYWNSFTPDLNWKKIWCLPSKYMITNKIKEVSFKIIHRFYPCKIFLRKYKKDIDVDCSFCSQSLEDLYHLFWSCPFSYVFWQDFRTFISLNILSDFSITYVEVLFGFLSYPANNKDQYYIINLLILLSKFHIHKSKFCHHKPSFSIFEKELRQYISTIQLSTNRKAVRTTELCTLYDIFVN